MVETSKLYLRAKPTVQKETTNLREISTRTQGYSRYNEVHCSVGRLFRLQLVWRLALSDELAAPAGKALHQTRLAPTHLRSWGTPIALFTQADGGSRRASRPNRRVLGAAGGR